MFVGLVETAGDASSLFLELQSVLECSSIASYFLIPVSALGAFLFLCVFEVVSQYFVAAIVHLLGHLLRVSPVRIAERRGMYHPGR